MSAFFPDLDYDVFVSYASPRRQEERLTELNEQQKPFATRRLELEKQIKKYPTKRQSLEKRIAQIKDEEEEFNREKDMLQSMLESANVWINTLINHLKDRLRGRLGPKIELKIWREPSMDGDMALPSHRRQAVCSSAVLLVILSEDYLASEWCRLERKLFLEEHAKRQGSPREQERIFVVWQTEIDREWPSEFADVRVCSFFRKDYEDAPARTLGMPEIDPNDQFYFAKLDELGRYLAECLQSLQTTASDSTLPSAIEDKITVFLAEVTPDLEERRNNLKSQLEQLDLRVLPETYYERSPVAFEKAMVKDLAKSHLFVQLVGLYTTPKTPDLPEGYEGLQLRLANKEKKPITRWFDKCLDSNNVRDQDLLNQEPRVMKMYFEEFKEEVAKQVRLLAVSRREPTTASEAYPLVDANTEDEKLAYCLCENLKRYGINSYHVACVDIESSWVESRNYHGLVVVYGQCARAWVESRIDECRVVQVYMYRKKTQAPVFAVYINPPKEPLKNCPPAFYFFNAPEPKDLEFKKFIEALKERAKHDSTGEDKSTDDHRLGHSNKQVSDRKMLNQSRNTDNAEEAQKSMKKSYVFISYCHDNTEEAEQLRIDLMAAGIDVWWDKDILPGSDWKLEIYQAMQRSDAVVLCLSKESQARSQAGIYPEARDAVESYRNRKPGSIFLIPVRFSACELPLLEIDATKKLNSLQYVDLFPELLPDKRREALGHLIKAIKRAAT